jgi:hypothetical protein
MHDFRDDSDDRPGPSEMVRKVGRVVVVAFLSLMALGWAVSVLFLGAAIISVGIRGDDWVFLLVTLLGAIVGGVYLIRWILRNTRVEEKRKPFRKKRTARPRPDGDMSDVAGIPQRDPWLG